MKTKIPSSTRGTSMVQLELPSTILKQLLQSGVLHGGDCKCLNTTAKRVLWQILLVTSTNNINHSETYLCA